MAVAPQIVLVGPVGEERHILVEPPVLESATGHALAGRILLEATLMGGSAYFASYSLERADMSHMVVTNVGEVVDTTVAETMAQGNVRRYVIDRIGKPSRYLTLWTEDTKHLFVRSAEDPSHATIRSQLEGVSSTVVAMSLNNPESYGLLADLAQARGHDLFVVPNQTLVGQQETLSRVLSTSKAVFLNLLEARATLGVEGIQAMMDRLLALEARAILVVTHSGRDLFILSPNLGCQRFNLPDIKSPRFVLGGGDMFAALAAAGWNDLTLGECLVAASSRSSELIRETSPFDKI